MLGVFHPAVSVGGQEYGRGVEKDKRGAEGSSETSVETVPTAIPTKVVSLSETGSPIRRKTTLPSWLQEYPYHLTVMSANEHWLWIQYAFCIKCIGSGLLDHINLCLDCLEKPCQVHGENHKRTTRLRTRMDGARGSENVNSHQENISGLTKVSTVRLVKSFPSQFFCCDCEKEMSSKREIRVRAKYCTDHLHEDGDTHLAHTLLRTNDYSDDPETANSEEEIRKKLALIEEKMSNFDARFTEMEETLLELDRGPSLTHELMVI
ncbi:hypothetical protein K435DRAFT_802968 [Dendrothele bispora CBS 962.96]|uniref:Uncharacterized protein n=1 Tax=Dendrothele bispora (strain CBS 962.96) TaxID=1314807 RepID=A0A4S8LJ34_DENBC|nr:hypothetical protein K435DRAFT_802968 [Dendrothele bispora CBS 962.96]